MKGIWRDHALYKPKTRLFESSLPIDNIGRTFCMMRTPPSRPAAILLISLVNQSTSDKKTNSSCYFDENFLFTAKLYNLRLLQI